MNLVFGIGIANILIDNQNMQLQHAKLNWKLKIINHDKAKYCSGYYFFPRNFKKFTKELSNLMGVEINIE